MPKNNPSGKNIPKDPRIDLKRVIFLRKKSDPPSEIVIIEHPDKDTTIISNVNNTVRTEIKTAPKTAVTPNGWYAR